jgi:hypothetical protein
VLEPAVGRRDVIGAANSSEKMFCHQMAPVQLRVEMRRAYSHRNAVSGSAVAAFRAGHQTAKSVTTIKSTDTATRVSGSAGLTSYSRFASSRLNQ